ncbi:MAG: FHA domain-containing protein [Desulfobacteraceae bacterium]
MGKLYILSGPDMGQSFELGSDPVYVGRSAFNTIKISDKAVSRRHLKILKRGHRYFIKDLESENGTFISGREISAGVDTEVDEGVPIVIGMSVICLGERCLENVRPVLDSMELSTKISEKSGVFQQHESMTTQKIMELVYKVSDLMNERLSTDEILEKILEYIFDFLRNIDRGVILLIDEKTGEISKVSSKLRDTSEDATVYCQDVVERVIKEGRGVVVPDVEAEEEDDLVDTVKLSKIESVMCVPVMSGSQIKGAIYVDSLKEPFGFRREDLSLFTDLGRRAALAVENALLQQTFDRSPEG